MKVAGGGELVSAKVASSLHKAGYRVLFVCDQTYFPPVLASELKAVILKPVPWGRLPFSLSHLLSLTYGIVLRLSNRPSILVDTLGLLFGPAIAEVTYVHYPGFLGQVRAHPISGRILSGILSVLAEFSHVLSMSRQFLVFNSNWSMDATLKAKTIGRLALSRNAQALVVYPPVDTKPLIQSSLSAKKHNMVLVLSRFSSVKNLGQLVDLAKKTPGVNYVVAGRVSDSRYFNELQALVMNNHLDSQIEFLTNISEGKKTSLLTKTSVLLHLAEEEHFGIVLVEGLAAGAIVIAKRAGGASEFVPTEWLYTDFSDVPVLVRKALAGWSVDLAMKNRAIAIRFDENNFRSKMLEIANSFFWDSPLRSCALNTCPTLLDNEQR
jgi:glycosyltransferase involved in cell wall biosynthesis